MRTVSRVSPDWVRRTMTLRRRCRSMPTYCCSCSTGVSFCRLRVGFATPSVLRTPGPGRRGDSRGDFAFDVPGMTILRAATGLLLVIGVRSGAPHRVPSRWSCAALLHHISCQSRPQTTYSAASPPIVTSPLALALVLAEFQALVAMSGLVMKRRLLIGTDIHCSQ